ncbi:hypothetical protein [Klebsiella aerogenes]|uniref:hypothetical protein n=1 Tax=Klebsiella aerogenes TaxID=548 RepID=UPI00063C2862|nr:hypothetical protein [Klebsiella aerogenes]KLE44106.1 hypothetical protein YA12_19530 [Klebsiella aerogenes]
MLNLKDHYIYTMAVETRDVTLIKVGYSKQPEVRLFGIQETTLIKVTLMTKSVAMTESDAISLEQEIHQNFECVDPITGQYFIQDGFTELHSLDQYQSILDMMPNCEEVMLTTKDYPERLRVMYQDQVDKYKKGKEITLKEYLHTMPEFKSTGNAAADDMMMKIRGGETGSYKL